MPDPPITVREDAPSDVRYNLVMLADKIGLKPSPFRDLVCEALRKRPNRDNWSAYPNIFQEVEFLVDAAPWFKVYDIAESVFRALSGQNWELGQQFQTQFNELLVEYGLGLQLKEGLVVVRGTTDFEQAVSSSIAELGQAGKNVASNEMKEAISDISRRPHADVSGAIQHAMAALECLARDLALENSKSLGQLLPELKLPKPMDKAVENLWGYASQRGRHLSEDSAPSFEEAALVVSIAGALCSYLLHVLKPQ